MSNETILLYSSGFESFSNLIKIVNSVKNNKIDIPFIFYFDLGLDYQKLEYKNVIKSLNFIENKFNINLLNQFHIVKLNDIKDYTLDSKTMFLPFRNLYFILLAINKLMTTGILKMNNDIDLDIILGYNKDDRVHDSGDKFVNNLSTLLSEMLNLNVTVKSLYKNETKISMVKNLINEYNLTSEEINNNVFSCYHPNNNEECLACKACFRKNVILYELGIKRPFYDKEIINDAYENIKNNNYITLDRHQTTVSYLQYLNSLE